jgi:hypothetical protein
MNATIRMILARERVAELLRSAERERNLGRSEEHRPKRVGSSYKLPNGSWIYRRRDSS